MSVNTQITPAGRNNASRSLCLWLKFKAKSLLVLGLRGHYHLACLNEQTVAGTSFGWSTTV